MRWWLGLAIATAGVLVMRWTGRWMAIFAALAACASLLAAGSLKAAAYVLRRAADFEGFDEDADEGAADDPPVARTDQEADVAGPLARMTMAIEKLPGRTAAATELALYFGGVGAALLALPGNAAAAGWAGAAAGLAASRGIRRWPRLSPAVFAAAAAPAVALAILWVPAPKGLAVDLSGVALAVMAGGACASGASIVMMRWRLSERLSLPPAMALAVWGLSWFFVQGEEFLGREDQPMLVAVGVGVGGAVAVAGWLLRAIDGPAAGVVFFLTSRVYSFVDWHGSVPFLAATVLGWRPLAVKRLAPGAKRSIHGAAYELLVGAVPFALAGGYFMSFDPASLLYRFHWMFLIAYAAFCAAAASVPLAWMLEGRPRARVLSGVGVCAAAPAFVGLFIWDSSYGPAAIAASVAGALLAWAAGEFLRRTEDWRALPSPVRRAALGCAAAVVALTIAAAAGYGAPPVAGG